MELDAMGKKPMLGCSMEQLQRNTTRGRRRVVGCIPYRYISHTYELEVLLVRSRNGGEMKFPKVVWELNVISEKAVERLAITKAGVNGKLEDKLGEWSYLRKSRNIFIEVHMFPLLVNDQSELWLEENSGQRKWVTVNEARNHCRHGWMNEALNILVQRCTSSEIQEEEEELIPLIARQNNDSKISVTSPEIGDSYNIDIESDNNNIEHRTHSRTYHQSRKVSLEWIFVITNFVLELPSVVLDQLSSAHKAQYELFAMLLSFVALFICIIELIYKGRKGQFIWRWRRRLPWFYNASQNYKPFGSFKDFVGSFCALCQCIVTAINYAQTDDKLINISFWPIIFAFGLLFSKMLENPYERRNE